MEITNKKKNELRKTGVLKEKANENMEESKEIETEMNHINCTAQRALW